MDQKGLRLLLVAVGALILLVLGLAIIFGLWLRDVQASVRYAQRDADVVEAIESIKVLNGRDGLSIVGPAGKDGTNGQDGQNSTSTVTIVQQPVKGDKGDKGDAGPPARQVEFDGLGNWKYADDEIWLPLFQNVQEIVTPLLEAE